ncbi:hypothetical protein [Saccharospirillum salsuginis]|uniref:Lipoxygenase domain-containing protein n=1 Tax=Saccharospirillum salsuginis TaxID=418750 RepID=A0A918K1Y9_9GAMM|nr:hypothetical protein [Saccharospirillum salsuginis]GGX45115.1 hypothetical protein GCM10007392_09950 [Saccharospirillum salsuginis]
MLEKILFVFYLLMSPIIILARFTKAGILKYVYWTCYYLKLVPILVSIYGFGLASSYLKWKWVQFKWLVPGFFGYTHFNRDSIELANTRIPGTDYHLGYIPEKLPAELVYQWRRDKVYHNYIRSMIRANHDYINVPMENFELPTPVSDDELAKIVSSSQISHYLTAKNGRYVFDMTPFLQEKRFASSEFEVASLSIAESFDPASMVIAFRDGTRVACGDEHWDLAKIYFLSNTMVFFILGAHLHHHLFFPEIGAAQLFNLVPTDSNFYKLMQPHTSYILMLNHQFKSNPLSLRETTGIADKFLYSCIGFYPAETFYKVGYENALNMYNKRETDEEALTQRFNIQFRIPFEGYLEGEHELNQQLKDYYGTVERFVSDIYEDFLRDGSEPHINRWVDEVCRYVNLPSKAGDPTFNIQVIATFIWYVSFVHSLEHYQFHKYKRNYCLLTRLPFAIAKDRPLNEVFTQYDIWKSKHIVLTFGKNHLNPRVSEGYFNLDYRFRDQALVRRQESFKQEVAQLLARFDTPAEAIALSIRY